MSIRPVKRLIKAKPTLEGAGVHLRRAFGFGNTSDFDPFLLLDDFRNDIPEDYLAGFPWHPHRGIETITYVLAGTVEHGDSMGNRGAIARRRRAVDDGGQRHHPPGDAQGRPGGPDARVPVVGEPAVVAQDDRAALPGGEGARHPRGHRRRRHAGARRLRKLLGQERPRGRDRRRPDLPRCLGAARASGRPCRSRRRATPSPTCSRGPGSSATRPARSRCRPKRSAGRTRRRPRRRTTARWCSSTAATKSRCRPGDDGIRFLLVSGKPLQEPVAWYGPIVMNTQEQLRQAFEELEQGTFLKPEMRR